MPEAPVKENSEAYSFVFLGWDREIDETCYGNASYHAVYEKIPIEVEDSGADGDMDAGIGDDPGEEEGIDSGIGDDPGEGSFLDFLVAFFESIINWFKSLFGIKD